MRTLGPLAAAAFTLAALAGCVQPSGGPSSAPTAEACPSSPLDQPGLRLLQPSDDPIDEEVGNATDFATTNVRTCSLPALGRFALDPSGTPHKYLGEMDLRGDLGLGAVAVVGSGEPGRVYVLDIGRRGDPQVLSFLDQPGAHVTDVKLSDDGKVLYTASQALPSQPLAGTAPRLVAPTGFTAYSLADPRSPAYLGTVADTSIGCHMLEPVQVAPNQDAVMCISQHLRSYLVQRDGPVLLNLGFVEYVPSKAGVPTPALPPAVGDPSCDAPEPLACALGGALASGPHDATAFHEGGSFGNGKSYLVVSHWGEGVKVLDITDAPLIKEVGTWAGQGATHYAGNVHTAMMFTAGQARYIVASPEYTSGGNVPSLWVLDASDLGNLRLVGEWWHPGNHTSHGLYLTTHQWQVAPTGANATADDIRIYLTYNHGGVWVLGLGAILRGDNAGAILGYNLARTPLPDGHVPNAVLSSWDVNVVDGYVYATDRATGLWVFHYLDDRLGDTRLRGFG